MEYGNSYDNFKADFEPYCNFMFVFKTRLNITEIFINLFDFGGFMMGG